MKRALSYAILVTVFTVLTISTQAQTENNTIVIVNTDIPLEEQATLFASNLGQHIDLDKRQISVLTQLRLVYLTELKKLQDNSILTLDEKEEANVLQLNYDEQFSTILTAEQKFKIRKRFEPKN